MRAEGRTKIRMKIHWRKILTFVLQNADIIVMLGLETIKADSPFDQKLSTEGKRIVEYATAAALHAPKAIFVDCVVPVSITLPIISEVYRRNHWYHPGKIVGSVSQLQVNFAYPLISFMFIFLLFVFYFLVLDAFEFNVGASSKPRPCLRARPIIGRPRRGYCAATLFARGTTAHGCVRIALHDQPLPEGGHRRIPLRHFGREARVRTAR